MTQPSTRHRSGKPAHGTRPLPVLHIVSAFVGMTIALTAVVAWGAHDPRAMAVEPNFLHVDLLDDWVRWDGGWYLGITTVGYSYTPNAQSPIAFFPSYPLAIRGLSALVGNHQLAAQLITWVCGLAAVVLIVRWVDRRLGRRTAWIALGLILLYPYAFFLHLAVYGDSMFILAAIGAFLLVEREQFLLAGLVAATATAARPVGLAVAIGVIVRAVEIIAERRRTAPPLAAAEPLDAVEPGQGGASAYRPGRTNVPFRALACAVTGVRLRHLSLLLGFGGLIAWCCWLWAKWGDPLLWIKAQYWWGQQSGIKTWYKQVFLDRLHEWSPELWRLTPQALACLVAVLLLYPAWRRFGWGYTAYALIVIAIPIIGTKDFMGCGRYILAAFPLFAAAADILAHRTRRWVTVAVLAALAALLIVMTYYYGYGMEMS